MSFSFTPVQVIEAWSQWSLYGLKTDKAMRKKVHNLIKRLAEAFHAEGLVRSASGPMCRNLADSSVPVSTHKAITCRSCTLRSLQCMRPSRSAHPSPSQTGRPCLRT